MSAIPSAKEIIELLKKGATLEAQEKIMELREALLSEREENHVLKQKIQELEKKLEIKGQLDWDGSVYWLIKKDDQNNEIKDGPYCQQCYDSNEKLIRLQRCIDPTHMMCNTCTHVYYLK